MSPSTPAAPLSPGAHAVRDAELTEKITEVYAASRGSHGPRASMPSSGGRAPSAAVAASHG